MSRNVGGSIPPLRVPLLPHIRPDAMAVGAYDVALRRLRFELLQAHDALGDREALFTANVIEVHHIPRKRLAAVGARRALQLSDTVAIRAPGFLLSYAILGCQLLHRTLRGGHCRPLRLADSTVGAALSGVDPQMEVFLGLVQATHGACLEHHDTVYVVTNRAPLRDRAVRPCRRSPGRSGGTCAHRVDLGARAPLR